MEISLFKKWNNRLILFFLAALKLIIHFLTNTRYGLHRDEFLYFEEGKHLAWGFFEVPPFTPFIGAVANLLGGSTFAIRLFPALAGVLIIILACRLVLELGGGRAALWITGLSLVFSPALLGSNTLFQPVSFNQLFWFLLAWQSIRMLKDSSRKNWLLFGGLMGLAFLTKYSVLFYLLVMLLALLFSPHRHKMWDWKFPFAVAIALLILSPNLWWQVDHGLPVVAHMQELRDTQLLHVSWPHFLQSQFRFHFAFSIVWIAGLYALLRYDAYQEFRYLAWTFLGTVLLIGALSGKSYYTAGAFLILFPFGGIFLEKWLAGWQWRAVLASMLLISMPVLPFSIPVLSLAGLKSYISFLNGELGIYYKQRWEDGEIHELPQDIADMHGWPEMVEKVARIYQQLPTSEQEQCMIYGGSYAHAAAINYYGRNYNLPTAQSLNSSYLFWANPNTRFDRQIMVDDVLNLESSWFHHMELVDSIAHPDARDPGYIYWRENPKIDVEKAWHDLVLEERKGRLRR